MSWLSDWVANARFREREKGKVSIVIGVVEKLTSGQYEPEETAELTSEIVRGVVEKTKDELEDAITRAENLEIALKILNNEE